MKTKWLFLLSGIGLLASLYVAYFATITRAAQPPLFTPATNPYADGIYAEGIVESTQKSGANVSLYPEVAGTVAHVLVREGQTVKKGDALVELDPSIQQANVAQLLSQAEASKALLDELKAEPRKETLDVAAAQVSAAEANLKTANDTLDKQATAYRLDPGSVSQDALDGARNAQAVAANNLEVTRRQYMLTKAGAWAYDVSNQQKQYTALMKGYAAASSLLAKYSLRAPRDGVILTVNTIEGAYVSPQGAYDSYTQGAVPVLTFGSGGSRISVRCYVDEILVSRLPSPQQMKATMTIRGTATRLPLSFDHIQPFVSPKIELSDQRKELVDVRVLPIIFQLERPKDVSLYPGELVDVYIGH